MTRCHSCPRNHPAPLPARRGFEWAGQSSEAEAAVRAIITESSSSSPCQAGHMVGVEAAAKLRKQSAEARTQGVGGRAQVCKPASAGRALLTGGTATNLPTWHAASQWARQQPASGAAASPTAQQRTSYTVGRAHASPSVVWRARSGTVGITEAPTFTPSMPPTGCRWRGGRACRV